MKNKLLIKNTILTLKRFEKKEIVNKCEKYNEFQQNSNFKHIIILKIKITRLVRTFQCDNN